MYELKFGAFFNTYLIRFEDVTIELQKRVLRETGIISSNYFNRVKILLNEIDGTFQEEVSMLPQV